MHDKSAGEPAGRDSRTCEGEACVQVGMAGEEILLRSAADPGGPRIAVSRGSWQEFVIRVKAGHFGSL